MRPLALGVGVRAYARARVRACARGAWRWRLQGGSVETIVCSIHPARRASLTCERCGSYACSDCAIDAPWGTSVCAPCKERGALCYPLAWDSGNPWSPRCFVESVRPILFEAPTLFRNLPDGSGVRALAFCAWIVVLLALSTLLGDFLHMRFDWTDPRTLRALSLYGLSQFLRQAVQTYTLVLMLAAAFHALSRVLGGDAPWRVALRVAAFGSAFLMLNAVATLTARLMPMLELAALVFAAMLQAALFFSCLRGAALERYGLSRARADMVAGAAVSVLVPIMLASMLLVAVFSAYCDRLARWFHVFLS